MAKRQTPKNCPYWNPNCDQVCTMNSNCGLYLPLPEHIAIFCSTPWWAQCCHYVRGCEAQLASGCTGDSAQNDGRRRFRRFVRQHDMTLAIADNRIGQPGISRKQRAWTIDLSMGGMRIAIADPLPTAAKINFSFGDDFPLPGFAGQAEICWQGPSQSGATHQCGLGFLDRRLRLSLGASLGCAERG